MTRGVWMVLHGREKDPFVGCCHSGPLWAKKEEGVQMDEKELKRMTE